MISLGKTPEILVRVREGMEITLGRKIYQVRKSIFDREEKGKVELWFLYGMGLHSNDEMFDDLGIEDRYQWCMDNKIDTDCSGIFPYMKKSDFERALALLKREFIRQGF